MSRTIFPNVDRQTLCTGNVVDTFDPSPSLTPPAFCITAHGVSSPNFPPDFPIDFSPGDSISLPNESYKLLKVPGLVDYVFGSDLAIAVDVALGL